jgi:hypothetical protein
VNNKIIKEFSYLNPSDEILFSVLKILKKVLTIFLVNVYSRSIALLREETEINKETGE